MSWFALAWLALLGAIGPLRAESQVHYFADRTFEIPFSMSPDTTFKRLHLHASVDEGKTYSAAGSTLQREGVFTYTARGDGWYFFVVQVENLDGTFTPARVNLAQPSMRVCIDTVKPTATLQQVAPDPKYGSVAVEWSAKDTNLDLQTLRLEYRATGGTRWVPLNPRQVARAQFAWFPTGTGPYQVRLLVNDKANNTIEVTAPVRGDPARPTSPRSPAEGAAAPTGDRQVIHVNKKSFKLTYKIDRAGPSAVKHVEVWMTRETTQWGRYQQSEAPPVGSVDVTVSGQGRYGFTLRPISGVGRGAAPPRAGDLPQVWVQVDETAPKIQLHNVIVNEGEEPSTITVNWHAEDPFLKEGPITIYYSPTNIPEAKWEVLQANVENTGTMKCKTDTLPFEFFVRVEAVDKAGNKAHAQTRETVKVDLSVPEVKDVGVNVGEKPPM